MRILIVVGARPNFMKAAPLVRALDKVEIQPFLVHTGQHFDHEMSRAFFELLDLPEPHRYLEVGGRSRVEQFAGVVSGVGELIGELRPDRVVTVGDVTSTAAAAVAADGCDVPVDHVEAGLRSFDLTMPEERNRRVADTLSELLFASEPSAVENLLAEGKPQEKIFLVGNVMIDTLERLRARASGLEPWNDMNVEPGQYAVVTAHRPANVDELGSFDRLLEVLRTVESTGLSIIFPVHPRTRKALERASKKLGTLNKLRLTAPMDYLSFIALVSSARLVLTDSGGLQEETTVLKVPCLTLRENTERPITLVGNGGTSVLVGLDSERVRQALQVIEKGEHPKGQRPDLWDGRAAERIAKIVKETA